MPTDWDAMTAKPASAGPMSQPSDLRETINAPQPQLTIPLHITQRLTAERLPHDRDGVLMLWERSKKIISDATAFEMEMRKLAVGLLVKPEEKKEGTNNVELGNGFVAKATVKYNYTLKSDKAGVDKIDAIDNCIDDFAKLDNEGSFIADRLFTWDVKLSVAEYRLLEEAAKTSATKAAMFKRLQDVLEIKEAAPTLEIREPKVKK